MNLEELQVLFEECKNDVKDILPIKNTFNKIKIINTKSCLGKCKTFEWCRGELFEIQLSKHVLNCSKDLIKNIIYHELIHTCRGCFNHGSGFKHYMFLVNWKLKANVEIKNTNKEFRENMEYKYKITCEKCGTTFYRHKLPRNKEGLMHAIDKGNLIIEQLY